ncbi:unnamed protein product [Lampetra planeri]
MTNGEQSTGRKGGKRQALTKPASQRTSCTRNRAPPESTEPERARSSASSATEQGCQLPANEQQERSSIFKDKHCADAAHPAADKQLQPTPRARESNEAVCITQQQQQPPFPNKWR